MVKRLIVARRLWAVLLVVAGLLLLAACGGDAPAASPTTDTRQYVAENFRAFFAEHQGLLGAPQSGPRREPERGRMVQYFANVRLEYDAANERIVLTPLGEWAFERAPTRTPPAPLGVAEAFDRFYAVNGGEAVLGPALSEVMLEDERWVRYHANARLEWDPGLPAGYRVQLAQLGVSHFTTVGQYLPEDVVNSAGIGPNADLTAVHVAAYTTLPIVFTGDTQTLVVTVRDLTDQPLDDIAVDAFLAWDPGTAALALERTDENGLARSTLDLSAVPPGTWVTVTVVASFNDRRLGETSFRFQVWW